MLTLRKNFKNSEEGFGLIEVLVVVIILGILAAIAIPIYLQQQAAAKDGATQQSLKYLVQAMNAAKIKTGKGLYEITGNNCTMCSVSPTGNTTDPATLPKTDPTWTAYLNTMRKISDASGMDVTNLVDGYGRPFSIDENEGENGNCNKDAIAVYADPYQGRGAVKYNNYLPLTTRACT